MYHDLCVAAQGFFVCVWGGGVQEKEAIKQGIYDQRKVELLNEDSDSEVDHLKE